MCRYGNIEIDRHKIYNIKCIIHKTIDMIIYLIFQDYLADNKQDNIKIGDFL